MSLAGNVNNLALRVASEAKALRTMINGNTGDLTGLQTTAKTNLVAAINELKSAIASASGINDTTTGTGSSWSSTKTAAEIDARLAAVIDAAPGALDTLNELAAALGDDPAFATTVNAALGNRVRFDAVQTLTGPQQVQARANIGAGTSSLALGTSASTAAAGDHTHTPASIGAAAASHTHTASQVSDASVVGKAVLTAADAAAARTAIGAGTSSLALGTTAGTAKAGDYAPPAATDVAAGVVELATPTEATAGVDATRAVTPAGLKAVADTKAAATHTHTASQVSDASTVGKAVMTATDAAAARTAIGAGTSSVVIGTASGQAADGALVGDTTTDFVATFVAALA